MVASVVAATAMFALLAVAPAAADEDEGPPPTPNPSKPVYGLSVYGDIQPKLKIVPPIGEAALVVPTAGPDRIDGYAKDGDGVFSVHFADSGYTFYVFVPMDSERMSRLYRLVVTVRHHRIEQTATRHGVASARAHLIAPGKVEVTWNAAAFPRLRCIGAQGGSPAPFMTGGDFTAENVKGKSLLCDFSDGVKTVFADIHVPIAGGNLSSR